MRDLATMRSRKCDGLRSAVRSSTSRPLAASTFSGRGRAGAWPPGDPTLDSHLGSPVIALVIVIVTMAGYFAGQQKNRRGSTSTNRRLHTTRSACAQRHDEFDVAWPLFFRAFGEYKNPVYIYLLAGVFLFAQPSNLVAAVFRRGPRYLAAVLMGWSRTRSHGGRGSDGRLSPLSRRRNSLRSQPGVEWRSSGAVGRFSGRGTWPDPRAMECGVLPA